MPTSRDMPVQKSRCVAQLSVEEKEKDNVVDFKPSVLTGGKGIDGGYNWLSKLAVGTIFLFRNKNKQGPGDIGVQEAIVIYKFSTATKLLDNLNGKEIYFIVDNTDFSAQMKPVEILYDPSLENSDEEIRSEPLANSEVIKE